MDQLAPKHPKDNGGIYCPCCSHTLVWDEPKPIPEEGDLITDGNGQALRVKCSVCSRRYVASVFYVPEKDSWRRQLMQVD